MRTLSTLQVWSIHVLPLDVGPEHLGGAEDLIAKGASSVSRPTAELLWKSLQESTPRCLRTFTAVSCCSCRSLIKPSVIEEGISAGGPLLLGIAWSGQALTNGSLSGTVKMSGSSAAMLYPGEATSATVDSKW